MRGRDPQDVHSVRLNLEQKACVRRDNMLNMLFVHRLFCIMSIGYFSFPKV